MNLLNLKTKNVVACLVMGIAVFFSSFASAAASKTAVSVGKPTGRVIKNDRWLNYPLAINGQRQIPLCGDVVTETSIIPQSDLHDQDYVCRCQLYRFTVPLSCASISWGVYNAVIAHSYSAYDKLIRFTDDILIDGYANVWVTVLDPVTGDPYSYEFAFYGGECCE